MDIRVRETQLCTLNGKVEGVPVFFLDVRYEHWRWDVIRSFAEIELFHSNVTKILKKDQVPEFPSGDTDPEELKVLMGGYFSELVALPHLEKELASFIGQSTATAECKPLDKPITQEGYLNVISDELNQDGKIPVFCLIIEDTLYIFNNRVIIGKAYSLPLNSLELYEAQISKEDNKVLIDGTVGTCELICKTSEIAEKWYSAVKSATEHESSELENELNAKQHSALAELSTAFPKAEEKELVRFLQSNAWNVDQCVAVYKAHIQWRNDTRIDELKISSVYHILSSGRAVYTKNKDKKGRPILYFRARLHDPTENFMDTYLIAMYLMDKMIEDAGDAGQIVVINDLNGFEKKNNDFRMNKLILEMVLAHYPNRVGAIWCTSTPWLFRMLFRVIKPWLGDELVSHVHLFGGTSELKEFVDENELLTDFGGTVDESKFQEWAKERAKKEGVSLDKPETHQFGNEEIVAAFSDAPVEHSAEGCIFEGWLKKQGGFVKKFNKRYCILKGTILYYYRTQKDLKADGVVFLRGARLLADQSSTFHIITSGGKDCIFQLYDKKQTQWLKVLENVILKNGGSIGHDDANIESVDPVDSFGITWQPKKESKKSKKSSSYLDELYFMFSDKSLRSFTMGRIPGNEIVSTIVKHTGKSREQAVEVGESWLHNQFLFPLSSKSTTFSDTEEESFLFSFLSGTSVLNFIQITSTSAKSSPNKIIESLHSKLVQIIKSKLLPDGRIDCEAIRSSREYFDFIVATADLQLVSLDSVKDKETFFFNLRSLLLLHAQITHGIGTDCATRFKIFTTSQYCVGMNRFSAADITHGILRANSPAPESLISKHFTDKKDPRTKFCCKNSDERIILATPGLTLDPFHFSTSYQDTLAQATVQFVSDVSIVSNEVFVSQILMWVNTEDKLEFLSQFLPDHRKPPQSAVIAPYSVNWSKFGLGSLGNS